MLPLCLNLEGLHRFDEEFLENEWLLADVELINLNLSKVEEIVGDAQ